MAATWPPTLPQKFLQGTYREAFPDNRLRTDMEQGPAKVRRRSTAAPGLMSGEMYLTLAEWEILDEFYRDTLKDGVLPFAWVHPQNSRDLLLRFGEVPTWRRVADDVIVVLEFEVLP